MLQSAQDAPKLLSQGNSLLGPGWKVLENFEDLDDEEFEDEEEMYVVMDLGTAIDSKTLIAENQYQLIGLDTPMPFLKLGNQVYQGELTPLVGDEVILGLIRNHENPHGPSRPPIHSTSDRITFRPINLEPRAEHATTSRVTTEGPSFFKPSRLSSVPAGPFLSGPLSGGALSGGPMANRPMPSGPLPGGPMTGGPSTSSQPTSGQFPSAPPSVPFAMGTLRRELSSPPINPPTTSRSSIPSMSSTAPRPESVPSDIASGQMGSAAISTQNQPTAVPISMVSTTTGAGPSELSEKPRVRGSRAKILINNVLELDALDTSTLTSSARITLAPQVEQSLGIVSEGNEGASSTGASSLFARTEYTPTALEKLKQGKPLSGPGSRGGKSGRRRRGESARGPRMIEEGDGGEREDVEDGSGAEDDVEIDIPGGQFVMAVGGRDKDAKRGQRRRARAKAPVKVHGGEGVGEKQPGGDGGFEARDKRSSRKNH